MTANGPKLTLLKRRTMSPFRGKADITPTGWDFSS
jgi:hypothetical protein